MNHFVKKLPSTHKSLKAQLKNAEVEYWSLKNELGESEDIDYHECDCEYCPVPEMPNLTDEQVEQKEARVEQLETMQADYKVMIRRVENYAKLVKVDL